MSGLLSSQQFKPAAARLSPTSDIELLLLSTTPLLLFWLSTAAAELGKEALLAS
jgi:hypothetical protein